MSQDAFIKIKGIKGYKMPLPRKELQMVGETDNEDYYYYDDDGF